MAALYGPLGAYRVKNKQSRRFMVTGRIQFIGGFVFCISQIMITPHWPYGLFFFQQDTTRTWKMENPSSETMAIVIFCVICAGDVGGYP